MTSRELSEYFEEVAAANAKVAIANPGDRRLAINAIMTLDAFFGALHSELLQAGAIAEKSDDKWKEMLAEASHHYRLLRDTAYALKHGNLTRPTPRLVRKSDSVFTMPGAFQPGAFQPDAFDTGRV